MVSSAKKGFSTEGGNYGNDLSRRRNIISFIFIFLRPFHIEQIERQARFHSPFCARVFTTKIMVPIANPQTLTPNFESGEPTTGIVAVICTSITASGTNIGTFHNSLTDTCKNWHSVRKVRFQSHMKKESLKLVYRENWDFSSPFFARVAKKDSRPCINFLWRKSNNLLVLFFHKRIYIAITGNVD